MRPTNHALIERVRNLAAEGYSKTTIASLTGYTRAHIGLLCKQHGIEALSGRVNYDLRETLAEMAAAGVGPIRAAADLGVCYNTVWNNLRSMGITRPRQKLVIDKIAECAAAGMTITETARKLGKRPNNVRNEAKRKGITFTAKYRSGVSA